MKSRFDPLTLVAMTTTVVSISATAPLTASASASPLAMAFWRSILGFAALGPLLLLLRRREVGRVVRGERGLLRREQWRPMVFGFLAATSLALHFASFMTSTRLTSVAMCTALVATQPVWQALIAAGQGIRTSRRTWTGLTLAVVGAAVAAGLDVRAGGTALLGDLLALGGALSQAAYTALSEKARTSVSAPLYSTVTSLVCGLELLVLCWVVDIPLTGFDRTTQLSLLGLLVLPQLLGLGSMNFALGRTSATTMSVLLLLETPVAALTAWWLMGQEVDAVTMPGLLLIIIGVTVVVTSGSGEQAAAAPQYGAQPAGIPPYPFHAPDVHQLPPPDAGATVAGPGHHAPPRAFGTVPLTSPRHPPSHRPPSHRPPQRRATERDPRVDWARHTTAESPTVQLAYHGAGAFDTVYLRGPKEVEEELSPTAP